MIRNWYFIAQFVLEIWVLQSECYSSTELEFMDSTPLSDLRLHFLLIFVCVIVCLCVLVCG